MSVPAIADRWDLQWVIRNLRIAHRGSQRSLWVSSAYRPWYLGGVTGIPSLPVAH